MLSVYLFILSTFMTLFVSNASLMDQLYEEIKHSMEKKRSYINDDISTNLDQFLHRKTVIETGLPKGNEKLSMKMSLVNATSRSIFKATMEKNNTNRKMKAKVKTKDGSVLDNNSYSQESPDILPNEISENSKTYVNTNSTGLNQEISDEVDSRPHYDASKPFVNNNSSLLTSINSFRNSVNYSLPTQINEEKGSRYNKLKENLLTDEFSGSGFSSNVSSFHRSANKTKIDFNEFFNIDENTRFLSLNTSNITRRNDVIRSRRSLLKKLAGRKKQLRRRNSADENELEKNDISLSKVNYDSMNSYLQKEIDDINKSYKYIDLNNIGPNHPIKKLLASQFNDFREAESNANTATLNADRVLKMHDIKNKLQKSRHTKGNKNNDEKDRLHVSSKNGGSRQFSLGENHDLEENRNFANHGRRKGPSNNNQITYLQGPRNINSHEDKDDTANDDNDDEKDDEDDNEDDENDSNDNDDANSQDSDDSDDNDYDDTYSRDSESYHRGRFHHVKVKLHGPGKSPEEWAAQEAKEISAMPEGLTSDSRVINTGAGFFQLDEGAGDVEITSSRDHGTKVKIGDNHFRVFRGGSPHHSVIDALSPLYQNKIPGKLLINTFNQNISYNGNKSENKTAYEVDSHKDSSHDLSRDRHKYKNHFINSMNNSKVRNNSHVKIFSLGKLPSGISNIVPSDNM